MGTHKVNTIVITYLMRRPLHALGAPHFEVRRSPVAGLGLFATQRIAKGTLITYYDGERIGWAEAGRRPLSHMRSVAFGHEAIDGLRTPAAGRGAGSFCNHADRPAQNAAYWPREGADGAAHVFIKALVDIPAGAEVLVSYGKGYWARGHDGGS